MALEERKKGVCQTLKLRENVSTNLDMDVVSVEECDMADICQKLAIASHSVHLLNPTFSPINTVNPVHKDTKT